MCEFFWFSLRVAKFIFLLSSINLEDPLIEPFGALARSKLERSSTNFLPLFLAPDLGRSARLAVLDLIPFPVKASLLLLFGVDANLPFESSINLGEDPVFLSGACDIDFLVRLAILASLCVPPLDPGASEKFCDDPSLVISDEYSKSNEGVLIS